MPQVKVPYVVQAVQAPQPAAVCPSLVPYSPGRVGQAKEPLQNQSHCPQLVLQLVRLQY